MLLTILFVLQPGDYIQILRMNAMFAAAQVIL